MQKLRKLPHTKISITASPVKASQALHEDMNFLCKGVSGGGGGGGHLYFKVDINRVKRLSKSTLNTYFSKCENTYFLAFSLP